MITDTEEKNLCSVALLLSAVLSESQSACVPCFFCKHAPLCVHVWGCMLQPVARTHCLLSNSLVPGCVLAADPADWSKHPHSVSQGSAAQSRTVPRLSDASLSSPAQSNLLAPDWHNQCICVCWVFVLISLYACLLSYCLPFLHLGHWSAIAWLGLLVHCPLALLSC